MRARQTLKMMMALSVGFALSGGGAGAAFAQDRVTEKVVIKKRTLIDFSDVNIEGELRKPDGLYFGSRKKTRFDKMINIRPHFNSEIAASMDQL